MNEELSKRSLAFADALSKAAVDALIITRDTNQRFLEGFRGSQCFLLASSSARWIVADSRYTEQARLECASARVVQHGAPFPSWEEVLASLAAEAGFTRVGFEKTRLSYAQYDALSQQCAQQAAPKGSQARRIELVPTDNLVEALREIKTEQEITAIRRACHAADRAFDRILGVLREGMTEVEVARKLELYMAEEEADASSFSTIVAFGPSAALPHAVPSSKVRLAKGDYILFDFGAVLDGYCSDMSRTVVFGKASAEQKKVYAAVRDAQQAAFEAMVEGASSKTLDAIARGTIEAAGLSAYGHGLGHGVGMDVHELPVVSRRVDSILKNGMVVTCEPGVYTAGWGGVRIEDTLAIRSTGPERLTASARETLLEL